MLLDILLDKCLCRSQPVSKQSYPDTLSLVTSPVTTKWRGFAHARTKRGVSVVVIHQTERVLMDCDALALWTKRPERTIRKHCEPVERGLNDVALYDADKSAELLDSVPQRARQHAA